MMQAGSAPTLVVTSKLAQAQGHLLARVKRIRLGSTLRSISTGFLI